jgi:hypothetical protein
MYGSLCQWKTSSRAPIASMHENNRVLLPLSGNDTAWPRNVFLAPQSRDPPLRNPMYSRATTAQFPTRQYQRAILNHVCQRLVKDRRAVCGTTLTEHCSTSQRNQRHRIVHPLTGRFGVPTTSLLAFIASAFYSPFSSSPWLDLTLPSIYILFPQLVVCHG